MNLPTIIAAVVVAAVILAVVIPIVKNKKNGKSACSCGGCSMNCSCHPRK